MHQISAVLSKPCISSFEMITRQGYLLVYPILPPKMSSYLEKRIVALLILISVLPNKLCAAFPCDVSNIGELSFSETPIGKTFNKATNRKECIIGCLIYPICNKSPQKKKGTPLDHDDVDKEKETKECEDAKKKLETFYSKGPGWHLYENKDRRDAASSTCETLPILVQGFEIFRECSKKKHICLMMKSDCYASRVSHDQFCAKLNYPRSCADVKKRKPDAKSGQYEIMFSDETVVKVMCEMSADGGGWMAIFNFTNVAGQPTGRPSNAFPNNLEYLSTIKDGNNRISWTILKRLMTTEGYTQIRIFCRKPDVGRTVDIATTNDSKGEAVIKHFAENDVRPEACGSFYRLPTDDSVISQHCLDWGKDGKWGHGSLVGAFAWRDLPFHIWPDRTIILDYEDTGRWECDDGLPSTEGSWIYYVR